MDKRIIIIGGGVAGLSAGIYSRLNGFDTDIVEMHSITGGQCTAWERKGYRFDYCLHWLVGTSSGLFREIWEETHVIREDTQIIDHDIHSVLIGEDGSEFIIYANISRWEEYLILLGPSLTYYNLNLSMKGDLESLTEDEFFQPLVEILLNKYPWMQEIVDESEINSRGRLDIWSLGLRYGIQIGFIF